MNSHHHRLAGALRERRAIIADEESRRAPEQHLDRLRVISEKISRLEKGLPQPVDPQLTHYLSRCSYDKALALLEAENERA